MAERYAYKWTSVYGESWDDDAKPWLNDLHDVTPEEFAAGVRRDLERESEWPPGSKEFRSMAIRDRRSQEPAHQLIERDKRIGRERDLSKGSEAIEAAKAMLRTGEVPKGHEKAVQELREQISKRYAMAKGGTR